MRVRFSKSTVTCMNPEYKINCSDLDSCLIRDSIPSFDFPYCFVASYMSTVRAVREYQLVLSKCLNKVVACASNELDSAASAGWLQCELTTTMQALAARTFSMFLFVGGTLLACFNNT
jgi:hypothetical protein